MSKGSLEKDTIGPGKLGICTFPAEVSDADIACILIWDRVLTDNERQKIEKWLGGKYGISIEHDVELDGNAKQYVAAVDVGVSREGELAQMPDILPLSLLQPTENLSSRFTDTLHEIVRLEVDVPRLEKETAANLAEITYALSRKVGFEERRRSSLAETKNMLSLLENTLEELSSNEAPHATFYKGSNFTGESFTMAPNEEKSEMEPGWKNQIRSIKCDVGLNVRFNISRPSEINFTGTVSHAKLDINASGKELFLSLLREWSNHQSTATWSASHTFEILGWGRMSSWTGVSFTTPPRIITLKVTAIDRAAKSTFKDSLSKELQSLRSISNNRQRQHDREKNTIYADFQMKESAYQQKKEELKTAKAKLEALRKERVGVPPPQMMRLFHTDPRGLTVSSALLGFAYSDSQPTLFDSAIGRMALYFKGLNEQFFSAYYDVNTARARWSLPAGSGSLSLVSYVSDSQINSTTLVVAKGGDADHCSVTIQNVKTGLTETWTDVPREVAAFALVLNGKAREKVFVGKLKTRLSGAAITSIALKDSLPREAPVGSTLIVEDNSSGSKLTTKLIVGAKANGGSKQISINSATPTINVDAKIYLLRYDYAAKASVNRAGYILEHGNLHVQVVVGSTTGKVGNATAKRIADAQSPQWVGDAPGSALYFDGSDDYLAGQDAKTFQQEGDISMEAWARPSEVTGDARLIHCKTQSSGYSLGLRQQALNSALSFNGGADDHVILPTASEVGMTNHDFTVEAWVKVNTGAKAKDQPILGNNIAKNSHGLHLMIRDNKPLMAFFHNDLQDDKTVLTKGTWYHLAFRYTAATKEQAIFVNGDLTKSGTAPGGHYQGTSELYIGRASASYLHGELDDVRIWNIAGIRNTSNRTCRDVSGDRNRA